MKYCWLKRIACGDGVLPLALRPLTVVFSALMLVVRLCRSVVLTL